VTIEFGDGRAITLPERMVEELPDD